MFQQQNPAQAAAQSLTQQQQFKMRFGCIAARIGADVSHKLGIDMPVEPPQYATATNVRSATRKLGPKNSTQYEYVADDRQPTAPGVPAPKVPKVVKAGSRVHLTVQDITRYPEEGEVAHWVCHHPECRGEKWASKRELLAAHPNQKDLERDQQTHMYYAVFEDPGSPGRPGRSEERDAEGKVTKKGVAEVEPSEARVMLLSDEE